VKNTAVEKVELELPERFARHVEQYYDAGEAATGKLKIGDAEYGLMRFKLLRILPEALKALISIPDNVKIASAPPPPAAEAPKPEEVKPSEAKDSTPAGD
jgi:hypothetical protein